MKPDILLIMPDQMRGDCMSRAGHPVVETPVIDEIGSSGTLFSRGYTTCASCIPARRSLLTGCFPSTNGMVGYSEGHPIPEELQTFPKILHNSGYRTAIAGRYMHQSPYDESYGYETRELGSTYIQHDDYAQFLERHLPGAGGVRGVGLSFNGWQAKPWPYAEELHPTNWTVSRAREMIAIDDDRPLFLTASFYAPHPPLFPPEFYMNRYLGMELPSTAIGDWVDRPQRSNDGIDAHRVRLEGEALRRAQAGYFGLIDHLDDQLYWLITEFKSRSTKKKRPWAIVFTSDHGEMLGDHHFFRKCEPYEGASRIPFLMCGSEDLGFSRGADVATPVCLEDIMPTILDLAGESIPANVDGMSLLPILRGNSRTAGRTLHGEHAPTYDQAQAYHYLTDGEIKYIWRPHDGSEQLFDLNKDAKELRNIAGDDPGLLLLWRLQLIDRLSGRPEGFVKDNNLIAGKPYPAVHT